MLVLFFRVSSPGLVLRICRALLTVCLPECLQEKACLLLDALLYATLAHTEVPQCGNGEAPQLLGALPTAEDYTWEGE